MDDTLMHLLPPSTRNSLMLAGLYGFWLQYISYLNVLTEIIC